MKFQQQPTIGSRITSQGDEQVDIYKVILLPKEDGQQNKEILDHKDDDQIKPPTNEDTFLYFSLFGFGLIIK